MFSIGYDIYLFVIFTVIALLEIQIEGQHGWARNLPCWRPRPDSFVAKVYAGIMGGKELTGYHIFMFSLPLSILHLPFVAGIKWTLAKELQVVSVYFLFSVIWDFLWFVWNPYYGVERFKPQFVSWHKKWLGPVPQDYLIGVGLSFIFAVMAGETTKWVVFLAIESWLLLISTLIAINHLKRKY